MAGGEAKNIARPMRIREAPKWAEGEIEQAQKKYGRGVGAFTYFDPRAVVAEHDGFQDYNQWLYYVAVGLFVAFSLKRTMTWTDSPVDEMDGDSIRLLREIDFFGKKIQIAKGDITEDSSLWIVNPANRHLHHGGGVAKAIAKKGGVEFEHLSHHYVEANGPLRPGENVALTEATGDLKARGVIHTVGPKWKGWKHADSTRIQLIRAVEVALKAAHDSGARSIAIPAVSSGIFGAPKDFAAESILEAVLLFAVRYPDSPLQRIRMTNIDDATVGEFLRITEKQSTLLEPSSLVGMLQQHLQADDKSGAYYTMRTDPEYSPESNADHM